MTQRLYSVLVNYNRECFINKKLFYYNQSRNGTRILILHKLTLFQNISNIFIITTVRYTFILPKTLESQREFNAIHVKRHNAFYLPIIQISFSVNNSSGISGS